MTSSGRIHVLSDAVINQIAAGEVVERPASVLKELVENSIDAGAARIEVEVVDGGRRLVRVRDDGGGMDRDNALLSIERHATSKLRELKDLDTIATMGFRGEALAAIASVSQFTIVTNRADSPAGTEILIFGGKIQDVRDAGAPRGTDIAVRNLFFNVPARRKFLRAERTELGHIEEWLRQLALARPDVELRVTHNGKPLRRYKGGDSGALFSGDRLGETLLLDFDVALQKAGAHAFPISLERATEMARSHIRLRSDHLRRCHLAVVLGNILLRRDVG